MQLARDASIRAHKTCMWAEGLDATSEEEFWTIDEVELHRFMIGAGAHYNRTLGKQIGAPRPLAVIDANP